ncbi:porin family protein [Vibrio sp. THAF190c]|uniref:porin family protein n=1 Tax=Vibrio sp. THAF190c TaxID=2587865 RepID=UPI001267B2C7|nr:porin family protein [Vibrio sp. THAF190c]QFT12506.1 outer membrane protein A [Vibrio sp. THAF190c]
MNKKLVLGAVLMSGLSFNSMAAMDRGWYVGGGLGDSDITSDTKATDVLDAEDLTVRAITGFKFNRVSSIEFQYTNYGEIKGKGTNETKMEPTALSIAGNIGYTFDNGLRPFGLIGLTYIDLDSNIQNFDDKGEAVRFGLGVEFMPRQLKDLSVRVAYESDTFDIQHRYNNGTTQKADTVTINSFYAAVSYHF